MFKTRLISGILLGNRCASYDHKRKLCAVCDIALRFSAWNAGTL